MILSSKNIELRLLDESTLEILRKWRNRSDVTQFMEYQEIISEAVRDFAKFYDGVTANGSSSMVDRFLTERFNHPPKTEGDYKCEGCGCDTDMIQPYCHQCEHESLVKKEVRLALEEASQAILSKRFFAERGHFGGEQAVRVKDIQQAFITPLTNK